MTNRRVATGCLHSPLLLGIQVIRRQRLRYSVVEHPGNLAIVAELNNIMAPELRRPNTELPSPLTPLTSIPTLHL